MAKAKKPPKNTNTTNANTNNEGSKQNDATSSSSDPIVLHQKLCLSIEILNRRLFGYTEMKIAVPDCGVIGLHAENLEIERVTVDGELAEFDVFPHYQPVEIENRWCSVSSVSSAADAAGVTYISNLERELVPNLLILCRKSFVTQNQPQEQQENGGLQNGEVKQNVKLIRIDYWVEKPEAGIHFNGDVLHTDNQIRRAHCWFPCIDDDMQRCCYDLEFTVPQNFVAVSSGSLLYQVLSKDDPPLKTFVYKLDIPVSARWISLAVGPFQILPDYHNCLLSHMCLPGSMSKLQYTASFFHGAFRHFEIYLKSTFPFGSYKQVFISPEMVISKMTSGASMSIFSSQILLDEKVIDQAIDTRIKLAYTVARQWFGVYITPETPNDEWLVEGLSGFLTDSYVKEYLGSNEARYRRYKANCAVCKADDSGATTLSPSGPSKNLYGTQSIGLYGRVRSWKSVAILEMLEKQMGPDLFRGILRTIVSRAQDSIRPLRTLSTKEFRHFANKIGNLERPFLKEFFHRWVETCGCPLLRMGFTYNKRKNLVELAAFRECTAVLDATSNGNTDSESREGHSGWPGMMTIKVHELDGAHDHLLPMAGEAWQLLEIKCHSRLATKRFLKTKKGYKPEGSDDNGETVAVDIRSETEAPLLWVRADPEMEYLAEIHLNQPLSMWIIQLDKDKDVVAQAQAIATLEELLNIPFPVINALVNFVGDSKAFWRVRIEAAFALAKTASEETDWAGMADLIKLYQAKRFDPTIGLPKPNDFHDFPEYFVLEAIPHAVATVRTADKKSPREAVEFVLKLLKYNDNSENPYSDVFWLAALVEAAGELEFGQQCIVLLSSLLKRIDRLLQFDRLMSSYNGVLTVSCIRTLTQVALKLSEFIPINRVYELIKSFRDVNQLWQVRIEASRALLDLEFHFKGIDAALLLFMKYLEEETSLRGQAKLGVHMIRLSHISAVSGSRDGVKSPTLVALLRLLESRAAFCNVLFRHHLFCILQVLAQRRPTLYVIPRDHLRQTGYAELCSEQRNNFLAFINQIKPPELVDITRPSNNGLVVQEAVEDMNATNDQECKIQVDHSVNRDAVKDISTNFNHQELKSSIDGMAIPQAVNSGTIPSIMEPKIPVDDPTALEGLKDVDCIPSSRELKDSVDGPIVQEALKDVDTVPSSNELEVVDIITDQEAVKGLDIVPSSNELKVVDGIMDQEALKDVDTVPSSRELKVVNGLLAQEAQKDVDTVSSSQERRTHVVKIRVKQAAGTSNRGEDVDIMTNERSQGGHYEVDHGATSSLSVEAPQRNVIEAPSVSNQIIEEVNSCQGRGSQMTASISGAKVMREGDELGKDLQCTADSSNILPQPEHCSSPSIPKNDVGKPLPVGAEEADRISLSTVTPVLHEKHKEKKKDKEKKRKREEHKSRRDDPEYQERKRLKKEKKRKEKEMAKLLKEEGNGVLRQNEHNNNITGSEKRSSSNDNRMAVSTEPLHKREFLMNMDNGRPLMLHQEIVEPSSSKGKSEVGLSEAIPKPKPNESVGPKIVLKTSDNKPPVPGGSSGHKLKIKIKNRTVNKS